MTTTLAQANGFDLSYLTHNSRGELSQGQLGILVSPLLVSILIFLLPAEFIAFQRGLLQELISGDTLWKDIFSAFHSGTLVIGAILVVASMVG